MQFTAEILPESPVAEAVFMLDETFEELVALAVERPADEMVFDGLRQTLAAASERGDIGFVMNQAVMLGAMACMHAHLEGLASEANSLFETMHGKNDEHGHDTPEVTKSKYDKATCKECKDGKKCSNRHL